MNRTLRSYFFLLLLALATIGQAQLSHGGSPLGIKAEKFNMPPIPVVKMPAFDVEAMKAEDEVNKATKAGPWRFGKCFDTDISLTNNGVWHSMPNGDRIWRVALNSSGAYSINFEFHRYELPEGAKVFAYPADRSIFFGSYTAAERVEHEGHGVLGVQPIPGDVIVIEYFEPAAVAGEGELMIGQVTHAYRDVFNYAKGLGDSGPCNNNVICPEGDPWRDQIKAVALVIAGGGSCSGTLVNNCAQDTTPYFLTADHCLPSDLDVSTWVFRFHWESPDCSANLNGPLNYTMSGASLLVNSAGTDVALLQFTSQVPDTFNVYYSGWDKTGIAPDSCTGIHHPSGDIKKISFDYDPPSQVIWGGADCWEVASWDDGTTEPGSSGSGLWSNKKRLIGQLFGGSASCTSITDDNYGRLDVSWPLLEPFLGTCSDTLDGFDPSGPNTTLMAFDAAVTSISQVPFDVCNDTLIMPRVTLKNNGYQVLDSIRVNWQIDGGPVTSLTWVGVLASLQTTNYDLPPVDVPPGLHTLTVFSSDPNGVADQNSSNDDWSIDVIIVSPGQDILMNLTLDEWGTETTWELIDDNGIVRYSGGPYTNFNSGSLEQTLMCLGDGCYTLVVVDALGDGICCQYGDGHYEIVDSTGFELVTGNGQFTDTITHDFCLINTSVQEQDLLPAARIWPNPTSGMLNIAIPGISGSAIDLVLFDATGRQVKTDRFAAQQGLHALDVSSMPNGVYLLQLRSAEASSAQRVVIQR